MVKKCSAMVKLRGRGVYGSKPCCRDAVENGFCKIHAKEYANAMAKLKAYNVRA